MTFDEYMLVRDDPDEIGHVELEIISEIERSEVLTELAESLHRAHFGSTAQSVGSGHKR